MKISRLIQVLTQINNAFPQGNEPDIVMTDGVNEYSFTEYLGQIMYYFINNTTNTSFTLFINKGEPFVTDNVSFAQLQAILADLGEDTASLQLAADYINNNPIVLTGAN